MKKPMATPTESFHIEDPQGFDKMIGQLVREEYSKTLKAKLKKRKG